MIYLKTILLIITLFTVGISASQTENNANAVNVNQSDDLVSETRNVSGFNGVDIGGTISAKVIVGQNFSVVVEAKEDILPKVVTVVKNNDLYVKFEKDFWRNRSYKSKNIQVRVTITLPELNDLDVSGASKAIVTGVNSDKLDIDVSGASTVSIEGSARKVEVDLSGASSLRAKNLTTEIASMDLSGASSARVNVSSTIYADLSGASSVRYVGNPQIRKDASGSSSISKM